MRRLRIYLDTSVINFLFADDVPDMQDATECFFEQFVATKRYQTFISLVVIDEINRTSDRAKRDALLSVVRMLGYTHPLRITTPLEVMGDD